MPIYEWACDDGHVHEGFAKASNMNDPRACETCGGETKRLFPKTHSPPSGVYSYAPNIGDPGVFEQRREAIKRMKESGRREAIPKIRSEPDIRRARDDGRE